jgi:aldehyde dehydrogenase (NAD+)
LPILKSFEKFTIIANFRGLSAAPLPGPQERPEVKYTGIFINNQWLSSESGKTFKTLNPTTGEVTRHNFIKQKDY